VQSWFSPFKDESASYAKRVRLPKFFVAPLPVLLMAGQLQNLQVMQ
jgi:hypothetical protein